MGEEIKGLDKDLIALAKDEFDHDELIGKCIIAKSNLYIALSNLIK